MYEWDSPPEAAGGGSPQTVSALAERGLGPVGRAHHSAGVPGGEERSVGLRGQD